MGIGVTLAIVERIEGETIMGGYRRDWIAWSLAAAIVVVLAAELIANASAEGGFSLQAGLRALPSLSDVVAVVAPCD